MLPITCALPYTLLSVPLNATERPSAMNNSPRYLDFLKTTFLPNTTVTPEQLITTCKDSLIFLSGEEVLLTAISLILNAETTSTSPETTNVFDLLFSIASPFFAQPPRPLFESLYSEVPWIANLSNYFFHLQAPDPDATKKYCYQIASEELPARLKSGLCAQSAELLQSVSHRHPSRCKTDSEGGNSLHQWYALIYWISHFAPFCSYSKMTQLATQENVAFKELSLAISSYALFSLKSAKTLKGLNLSSWLQSFDVYKACSDLIENCPDDQLRFTYLQTYCCLEHETPLNLDGLEWIAEMNEYGLQIITKMLHAKTLSFDTAVTFLPIMAKTKKLSVLQITAFAHQCLLHTFNQILKTPHIETIAQTILTLATRCQDDEGQAVATRSLLSRFLQTKWWFTEAKELFSLSPVNEALFLTLPNKLNPIFNQIEELLDYKEKTVVEKCEAKYCEALAREIRFLESEGKKKGITPNTSPRSEIIRLLNLAIQAIVEILTDETLKEFVRTERSRSSKEL